MNLSLYEIFDFRYYMFGEKNPWLTIEHYTLRNQWGNETDLNYIWERITGYVDLWHKAAVDVPTTDGYVEVR